MVSDGFEPPYLIRESDLQSDAFNHSANLPLWSRADSNRRPVYSQYQVIHNLVRFQIGSHQQPTISHFVQNGLTEISFIL